eukprot:360831-Chlamydomonas_euryale.AAC.4
MWMNRLHQATRSTVGRPHAWHAALAHLGACMACRTCAPRYMLERMWTRLLRRGMPHACTSGASLDNVRSSVGSDNSMPVEDTTPNLQFEDLTTTYVCERLAGVVP